jgi:hypothetical protein
MLGFDYVHPIRFSAVSQCTDSLRLLLLDDVVIVVASLVNSASSTYRCNALH